MGVTRGAVIAIAMIGSAASMLAQTQAPADFPPKATGEFTPTAAPDIANGPTPRMPDGHPDLQGPWTWSGAKTDGEKTEEKPGELPLLPWAKALKDSRKEQNEPYLFCAPMGLLRHNPFPWNFIQSTTSKGPGTIYMAFENGGGGAVRQIFMDGRKHPDPDDRIPTWWGHSIGHWEGDTLVVDTVGYNDKSWLDSRGTPHTDKLHTIERWTRTNYGTLVNDVTLDDPVTFSQLVQLHFVAHALPPGEELMEYICVDNDQYGAAAGLENPYKGKGFGLEVQPGEFIKK
jgi:hypothetical protein